MSDCTHFAFILSSQLFANTDAFLSLLHSGIYETQSPLAAAHRFSLQYITIYKKLALSEHECSSARLKDLENPESPAL